MKLSGILLAFVANVQSATFQAPGNVPTTGERHRLMMAQSEAYGGDEEYHGATYGASGDLISAEFAKAFQPNEASTEWKIWTSQANNDDTWFYYLNPLTDSWYKVVYQSWSASPLILATGSAEINGTTAWDLDECNQAIRALYEADEATTELTEDCEEKCVLFTVATDWTDAKDCSDPAGSLKMGSPGSGHEWLDALRAFTAEVEEKLANGEETNYLADFVPPHVVGSKLNPEVQNATFLDSVNATQIANHAEMINTNTTNCIGNCDGGNSTAPGDDTAGDDTTVDDTPADNSTVTVDDSTTTTGTTTTPAEEEEESGFLVNSVSLVLFASMAIFK